MTPGRVHSPRHDGIIHEVARVFLAEMWSVIALDLFQSHDPPAMRPWTCYYAATLGEGATMSDAYDEGDDTTEESDRRFIRDFVDLASAAEIRRLAELICNDRKLLERDQTDCGRSRFPASGVTPRPARGVNCAWCR